MEVMDPWTAVPSRVTTQSWIVVRLPYGCLKGAERPTEVELQEAEEVKGESSLQVEGEPHIQHRVLTDDRQEDEHEATMTGMWTLYLSHRRKDTNGYTEADRAWFKIRNLIKSGELSCAMCSTPNPKEAPRSPGIIVCYPPESNDSKDIRNSADAIRKAVHYPWTMHYKTDENSLPGVARNSGYRRASLYKHTVDNLLYVRHPPCYNWKLIGNGQSFDTVESKPGENVSSKVDNRSQEGKRLWENDQNEVKYAAFDKGMTNVLNSPFVSKNEANDDSTKNECSIPNSFNHRTNANFEETNQMRHLIAESVQRDSLIKENFTDKLEAYLEWSRGCFLGHSIFKDHGRSINTYVHTEPNVHNTLESNLDNAIEATLACDLSRSKNKPWIYGKSGDLSQFPEFGHESTSFEQCLRNFNGFTELD